MMENIQKYIPINRVYKLRQRYPEKNNNNYDLEIGERLQVKQILEYIYNDAEVYLDRKYERYKEFLNEYNKIYN